MRDGTGALIPGASVMAKNVETGITRTTMSDEQGRYQLLNLNVGRYEIEVSLSGFQTAVRSGIVLAVGDRTVVNFTLQVGQVAEKVEVTAQAPLVDTTTSSVGGIIETSQIVNLPLNGRSFDELAQLQPGVTVAKFAGVGTMQSGYTTKISIRGARPEQNSFLLDGTDVMGPTNQIPGSVAGQSFGVDAVREFRVETSTYSAQYGRAAGGVINVVTKSGTNELHGSAFEFLRNDNLDAATWDDNRTGRDKPEFKCNQFGFSLGGPVRTDRTFFFGWSQDKSRNQFVTLETTHIFSPTLLNSARLGFNRSFTSGFGYLVGDQSAFNRLPNLMPGRPVLVSGGSLTPGDIEAVGNDNLPCVWSWNLGEISDDVDESAIAVVGAIRLEF